MVTKVITNNTTGGDFTGTASALLAEAAPTSNFGTDLKIQGHNLGGGTNRTSVLAFPGLSNITGPVTVSSATLSLYHLDANTAAVKLQRCLRNWVELQATWNVYSTGNAWTTGGGQGSATDVSATLTINSTTGAGSAYNDFTSAQLATDVQNFINGVNANYGWVLMLPASTETANYASEDEADTFRPKLTVVYTVNGGDGGIIFM